MISHINSRWKKLYRKLPTQIRQIAKKQYKLFKDNPYHSSLHFKKIHSSEPIFSARITANYRTLGVLSENNIIWFWIGSHDEYERLIK
jgi:mRNA-degrading endonuclease RelE of RelBE toxin-antitoxin system